MWKNFAIFNIFAEKFLKSSKSLQNLDEMEPSFRTHSPIKILRKTKSLDGNLI